MRQIIEIFGNDVKYLRLRWKIFEANDVNDNVCDDDHFVLGVQLKLRVVDVDDNHDILNDDNMYQPSAVLPDSVVRMKAMNDTE